MTRETIEVSNKGKWSTVPALKVNGKSIVTKGNWIRTACIHAEEWLETPVENPDLCIQALREDISENFRADIFTFCQKLPNTQPLYRYPMEWESVAAIRVKSFSDWWEGLPQKARKNARRSQKRGVSVEVKSLDSKLIEDLVALNNDCPVRQGKAFTHFGKTFEQVQKDQQDFLDRCDYICAYFEEELIGMAKLIYRGDIASILFFLPKASHSDKRPSNALIAKVVERCEEKKIQYLTYGLFNYHNRRDTSLREFKIRTGFEEVLIPRYFVPLTLKGRVAVLLRLHRGPIGLVPTPFIELLTKIRTKLYSFNADRASQVSHT
jgi:hypothetical protein